MIPTRRHMHEAPTREIIGDFPVHYLYTVGIAGEKFFKALKEKRIIGNKCESCDRTYVPPKIYCEDCFDELGDDSYKDMEAKGTLFSFTEVFYDHRGDQLKTPYYLGLIKIHGSHTTLFHRLVNLTEPSIGMDLKAQWNEKRVGSIFDLVGFEPR